MKHSVACLVVVMLVAVCVTGAQAQLISNMMRGNTAVARPSASTAWYGNPAVLAPLASAGVDEYGEFDAKPWANSISGDVQVSGDGDMYVLSWGGQNLAKGWGIGGGYANVEDGDDVDVYGLGFGRPLTSGWSVGVNWMHTSVDSNDTASPDGYVGPANGGGTWSADEDTFDLAVRKDFANDSTKTPWLTGLTFGAVLRDVTDEIDSHLDLGVALDMVGGWTLAADLIDFDDINVGASMRFGEMSEWEFGAGLSDGDPTLGFMYDVTQNPEGGNLRVGAAWADYDADDVIIAGAVYDF